MPLSREENSSRNQPSGDPRSALATGLGAETSAAFTPGPWEIHDDLEHPLHLIWWSEIAGAPNGPGILVARTCFAPSSEANARLIAAAPDLYTALKAIRAEQAEGYCSDATRALADAALAKVEAR